MMVITVFATGVFRCYSLITLRLAGPGTLVTQALIPMSLSMLLTIVLSSPGNSVQFGFNAQKGTAGGDVQTPSLSGICRNTKVNQAPIAELNSDVSEGPAPLTVNFTGSASTDPDGDPLTYQWQLMGQTLSEAANFEHVFNEPGAYQVSLTVHDGELSSIPVQTTINVKDPDDNSGGGEDPESSGNWQLSAEKSAIFFVIHQENTCNGNSLF